ncbi:MAG: hypothetical protein GY778_08860 [bacterium]|nr:hypothetical protein [bacterium]
MSDPPNLSWRPIRRILPVAVTAAFVLGGAAVAADREDVVFSITYETVLGQSVYVLGDIPELGSNDPAYAVKLEPNDYPLWQATLAIPKGTSFTYQYTWRDDSVAQWSNSANHNPIGSAISDATGPADPRPARKGLYYLSTWTASVLNWRTDAGGAYTATAMSAFGPGRSGGETRWRAVGVGTGQRRLEFYFTDGGSGRDPVAGTYVTELDAFFVQDGHLFGYAPAAGVSDQRRDYNPASPPGITSTVLGEFRRYRVLLPRGYDEHLTKRYPVLYMHDGQNVFEMGPFGTWNAEDTAEAMTRDGAMAETIIVGVDNTANRYNNYVTPDDGGQADDYADFLINELKPLIDGTYRTLADRDHTATIGSSLGGVVSLYLGWDFNGVFGKCGPMSGSWWLGNFPNRVSNELYRDLRIYLDSGDSGTSNDGAWGTMSLRDNLNHNGYVLERDLRHVVGYGHQHNEAAWSARLPYAYEFLFPATEAENPLLTEIFTGDLDFDGDMDLDDWTILESCLGGPAVPPAATCPPDVDPDLTGDGPADLADFATFQVYYSG